MKFDWSKNETNGGFLEYEYCVIGDFKLIATCYTRNNFDAQWSVNTYSNMMLVADNARGTAENIEEAKQMAENYFINFMFKNINKLLLGSRNANK